MFLFWWPEHVAGEGLLQLVLRGLLWTLTFELLLLSLAPAEKLAGRRLRRRALARGARVKSRLADVPAPARTGGVVALACCGLAAPLALIADAPTQLVRHVEGPQVVKQVIVERPVIEKKVVVRKVVAPAPQLLQATGAAPSVATSQVSRPVARKAATVAPERTSERSAMKTSPQRRPTSDATGTTTTATSSIGTPATATQGDATPAEPAPAPAPAS